MLIPLGADADRFRPDPDAGAARQAAAGIPADARICLYAGKVLPTKRLDALIDAARLLAPRQPALHVAIVGEGPAPHLAALRARAAGLPVSFHPAVPNAELPTWFNAAEVVVWPADVSNGMIEAAACGRPLVVARHPQISYQVEGDNALVIDRPGDAVALAAALRRLLADASLAARLGDNGRALVVRRLSWEAIGARFVDLFRDGPAALR